ncbi:hypothetical protein SAY86_007954 [Trapa natans]|uniref:UspA domain-containing protein n=1 Tax=Trapa natans TaxID=22666 RepID=A0AAN7LM78_TRANT|nr:hypothetical protein SAY86_007954 [Trapa natans]
MAADKPLMVVGVDESNHSFYVKNNVTVDVMEGDPRTVMCEAVEKYRATVLVVGSHGYGPMKRAVLGSVSDFCAHPPCSLLSADRQEAQIQAIALTVLGGRTIHRIHKNYLQRGCNKITSSIIQGIIPAV